MIATCTPPKKPQRLYERTSLNIRECDGIELDSLEGDTAGNTQDDFYVSDHKVIKYDLCLYGCFLITKSLCKY